MNFRRGPMREQTEAAWSASTGVIGLPGAARMRVLAAAAGCRSFPCWLPAGTGTLRLIDAGIL